MALTSYLAFAFQLMDSVTGRSIIESGGTFVVLQAGLPDRQTAYSDAVGTSLSNSAGTPTRGKVSFWCPSTVTSVDVVGFAPGGQFFYLKGLKPSGNNEYAIDTSARAQVAYIPYSIVDATANVEKDTGLDLPANADVSPFQGVVPTVAATAGNTGHLGLLSTESGGDADGFQVSIPMNGTASVLVAAKSASTATRGALIGAGTLDRGHSTDSVTAKSLSYTLAASFATGKGFFYVPYTLGLAASIQS